MRKPLPEEHSFSLSINTMTTTTSTVYHKPFLGQRETVDHHRGALADGRNGRVQSRFVPPREGQTAENRPLLLHSFFY